MKTIGLDIGSTGVAIAVYDIEKRAIVSLSNKDHEALSAARFTGEHIMDPGKIVKCASALLKETLLKHRDVAAIGIDAQMHGILYLSEKGEALSPFYTWQDNRGNIVENGHSLKEEFDSYHQTKIFSGYGLLTHIYNQRHGLVPKEAVTFADIGTYFAMELTQVSKPLIHCTMADSFGFYDYENNRFDEEFLNRLGVPSSFLPQTTPFFETLGYFGSIPVSVCLGDCQASFLGASAGENKILINVGTGSQILYFSKEKKEVPGMECRPYLDHTYLLTAASLSGGKTFAMWESFFHQYLKQFYNIDQSQYENLRILALQEMLKQKDQPSQMSCVATFSGSRLNPEEKASFNHIAESDFNPATFTLALLKGMADELVQSAQTLRQLNPHINGLVGAGNGLRKNEAYHHLLEASFDLPLEMAPYEEEAACGSALAAIKCLVNR